MWSLQPDGKCREVPRWKVGLAIREKRDVEERNKQRFGHCFVHPYARKKCIWKIPIFSRFYIEILVSRFY